MHRRTCLALGVLTLLAAAGCNTGKRDSAKASTSAPVTSSTTGGTTSSSNPTPTAGTLDATSIPAAATEARISSAVLAGAFELAASGAPVEVAAIKVSAVGTLDESKDLGGLALVGDDNRNGRLDPGEPVLAAVPGPAFTANDGSVTVTLANPVTIAAGARLRLLIVVDAEASSAALKLAKVGKTLDLAVSAAADITATSQGQPVTPQGTFPLGGGVPLPLFLHDSLLITEVVPTGAEYVEIANPTARPVDLAKVYLSDANDGVANGMEYWKLPTGQSFGPANPYADFVVRFPQGALAQPGQCITIAIDGVDFEAAYGKPADFCLRNPSGGSAQMLTALTNGTTWSPVGVDVFVELYDTGEQLVLFTWDGAADLVKDIDYVYWGTVSTFNTANDKSGRSVDGPDAGTQASAFLAETPAASQLPAPVAPAPSHGVQRVDWSEGGEKKTGGNGLTGNDETSEPWAQTFRSGAPTPGAP